MARFTRNFLQGLGRCLNPLVGFQITPYSKLLTLLPRWCLPTDELVLQRVSPEMHVPSGIFLQALLVPPGTDACGAAQSPGCRVQGTIRGCLLVLPADNGGLMQH